MQTRTLNGRYRLDELIGEGGMAVVYRGYDLVLNRQVAVKLLRDQYGTDESFLIRFDREAQSAAGLSHPNVVNVYDVGQDNDDRFIVMEHIEGPNLKELIRRQGPFSVDGAGFVIRQIANGLDYAHARGLVHRDIKPQNMLVDDDGNVKVADFGIAKGISDTNLTEAGTGMGTVHYVSPEQAKGEPATPLSDVYSTGVVLFEMLTRTLPFHADTQVGVAMQHVTAPPPRPTEINPALPAEIDDLMLVALAKDPSMRFQSAGELASAVEALGRGEEFAGATALAPGVAPGGGAAAAGSPPRRRGGRQRGGRGAVPPPADNFRDDVGCVTWLIGSAILVGLIALVFLAFRLGDFGLFEPSGAGIEPTPTETVETTPTVEPTEEPTATPEATPEMTPTPEPSPSPSPTPEDELATIPNFIEATLDQAESIAVDFQLNVVEVFSDSVPAGRIISQDPAPGTELEVGSQVTVRVSIGPEFVSIPNLAGQSQEAAVTQLQERGLSVNVAREPSQNAPAGQVIRTEPTSQIRQGGTVTLVVSRGDAVQVPDVFRQPLNEAVQTLQAAGLQVGTQSAQSCEFIQSQNPLFDCANFPNQHVVSGTLQWNEWVPRGSTIDIAYYDAQAE